jgi:hypothetical protein
MRELVFGIMCLYWQLQPARTTLLENVQRPAIAYFALSFTTTVLSTILIITRIAIVGRIPGVSTHRKVIEMVVESAALYSLALTLYVPFYVLQRDPILAIFSLRELTVAISVSQ